MSQAIVLTGGGTGGHVFPLRAIAEALMDRGVPPDELVIVGSSRGQERGLLADLGVELVLLPGRGLSRHLSWSAARQNLSAVAALTRATRAGVSLVARRRPRAVVSVGGYAAFAAGLGAVVARRPLVLVDLDATPGLVHRVLRPAATAVATAFPDASPRATRTGTPVRTELAALARTPERRAAARAALGLPASGKVVGVMTGSLGAASVNRAVCEVAVAWAASPPATLYHVTGRRDESWVRARHAAMGAPAFWRLSSFEERMADFYAASDVAVCRAGATTVAELCATATPSVLVPLPTAPGAHQHANARVLVAAGAAVLVEDAEADAQLAGVLDSLLEDRTGRSAMSAAASRLARPDAAARVADLVLAHAR